MGKLAKEISDYYGFDLENIENILKVSHLKYKYTTIPKKNGSFRDIYMPSIEIKAYQYYVLNKYLKRIKPSSSSYAYLDGKSIKHNASLHKKSKHFLFIDVKHFFESMNWIYFKKMLLKYSDFSDEDSFLDDMYNILTMKGYFVQGSVTSPYCSNIYMIDIDKKILDVVGTLKDGQYSRYSDDITISSSEFIDNGIAIKIKNILNEGKLSINYSKLKYSSIKGKVRITGINLIKSQNKAVFLSIGTDIKKLIKDKIYKYINNLDESITKNQVLGYLYYLKMVEPKYYIILNQKYKSDTKLLIDRLKYEDDPKDI